MCGAVFALRLSPCERRGLAAFALLAGGVVAITSAGVTLWQLWLVAGDPREATVEPAWAWGLAISLLALASTVLGIRVAHRGWRGACHQEPGLRFGRGLWVTWAAWVLWQAAISPFLAYLPIFALPYLLAALLALLVASRVVAGARAVLD